MREGGFTCRVRRCCLRQVCGRWEGRIEERRRRRERWATGRAQSEPGLGWAGGRASVVPARALVCLLACAPATSQALGQSGACNRRQPPAREAINQSINRTDLRKKSISGLASPVADKLPPNSSPSSLSRLRPSEPPVPPPGTRTISGRLPGWGQLPSICVPRSVAPVRVCRCPGMLRSCLRAFSSASPALKQERAKFNPMPLLDEADLEEVCSSIRRPWTPLLIELDLHTRNWSVNPMFRTAGLFP